MSEASTGVRRGSGPVGPEDFAIVEVILRSRYDFFAEIREGISLPEKMQSMVISSTAFFALYGAVMGSSHSLPQTLSSGAKLPLLFMATLFVCAPSLYFFNLLFGSNQSLSQNVTLILTSITVTSVLLLSFAPITLFFLITTSEYQFFKLLNVAIFGVSGLMGVVFLYQGMRAVSAQETEGAGTRKQILIIWMFVYAFVGSQMAWTIRPFIGAPGVPFELFRQLGGSFYSNVFWSLGEILGFVIVR